MEHPLGYIFREIVSSKATEAAQKPTQSLEDYMPLKSLKYLDFKPLSCKTSVQQSAKY